MIQYHPFFALILLFGIYTSANIQHMWSNHFSLEKNGCKIIDDNFINCNSWIENWLIDFNNYLIEYCILGYDSWEVIIGLANRFVPMMTQFRDNHMLH